MPSNKDDRISVQCSLCGKNVYSKSNLTRSKGEYFCDECVMNIECSDCGKDLKITKKQASELGEDILCKSCGTKSSSKPKSNDDSEKSIGIISGFALYLSLGVFAMGIGTFYIVLTGGTIFGPKHEAFAKILVPILFVGYLVFR